MIKNLVSKLIDKIKNRSKKEEPDLGQRYYVPPVSQPAPQWTPPVVFAPPAFALMFALLFTLGGFARICE